MNKHFSIYTLMLLLPTSALLAGCGSVKSLRSDYRRPALADSDVIRKELPASQEAAADDSLPHWREFFTDSELQCLIAEGLSSNADLQVARLKVEEAQATLSASRKASLPTVSMSGSATANKDKHTSQQTYSVGPEVSWEADIFARLSNAAKAAAASVEEQQAYAQAVQTQLVATIARDYYQLLAYDTQVDVTRKTIKSWEEYIRTQRALMKAGQADMADINQAEASRLSAETTLQTLLRQTTELENSLATLVGRQASAICRSSLDSQQLPTEFSRGVSVVRLASRPDVRRQEAMLKQAFYNVNKARAAFYPKLTLSGSAGWTNSTLTGISNPGSWLLSAAANLVQPILNNGQNTANLKIAQAQQQEALVNWKQSILDAGREVNNALADGQSALKTIDLEQQQISRLEKTLSDTEAKMRYGSTNYLQVVIARQSLLSAQLSLVTARYNSLESTVNLYEALGGGNK